MKPVAAVIIAGLLCMLFVPVVVASEFELPPPGVIPSPIDRSELWKDPPRPLDDGRSRRDLVLPVSYDLRKHGRVPPIRNQGHYGTCWAHAAIGAMESSYLTQYPGASVDLSEMHLAYFVYGDSRPGKSFALYHEGEDIMDQGGNSDENTAFLSRMGTVSESILPYPPYDSYAPNYTHPDKLPEDYESSGIRLKEVYQSGGLGYLDGDPRHILKKSVITNGAAYISYRSYSPAYTICDNETVCFFNSEDIKSDGAHAVLVVGWDDNFPRENFPETMRPAKNGAWLVRNSWGKWRGSDGYFWMSYEQWIDDFAVFIADKADKNLKHYGHDDLGYTGSTSGSGSYSGEKWAVAIFKAESDEVFRYAGFYTTVNNVSYEIYVFDLGTSAPVAGKVVGRCIAKKENYTPYAGYHTEEFSAKLEAGHYFSVVVKTDKGNIALERPRPEGYPTGERKVVVKLGESYYSYGGKYWYDMVEEESSDVCVKAFTIPFTGKEKLDPMPEQPSGLEYDSSPDLPVVKIDEVNFPDNYFRSHVNVYDRNKDGWLSNKEISYISAIGLNNSDVESVEGIGNFFGLVSLNGTNNMVKELNLKRNTALTHLNFYSWRLGKLDVSKCTRLVDLHINIWDMKELDLSNNKALKHLELYSVNTNISQLNFLDVSKNTALLELLCSHNCFTELDLSGNKALISLDCSHQYPKKRLKLTKKSDGYYYACLKDYISGDISRVLPSSVKSGSYDVAYDITYDKATGIIKLSSIPGYISYEYDTYYHKDVPERYMDVNISPSGISIVKPYMPDAEGCKNYSVQLELVGANSASWDIAGGKLPAGLSLNASTGKILGTPTESGNFAFTVRAKDRYDDSDMLALTLNVKAKAPAISTAAALPGVSRRKPYSVTLNASGTTPLTWMKTDGTLPDGLTLTSAGKLSGTPTKAGTYSFTVKASNAGGSASRTFTLKVTQTTVTGDIPTSTTRRASYTGTPTASGGASPYIWSISVGKLPDGLKINSSTGKITGTPTKAGTFNFTVKAKDKNGAAGSKAYTVKVTQTTVTGDIPTTTTRRAAFTGTPKVSGGAASYTWSISEGKLPDGLKIDSKTGKITGTATKAGNFTFTVKAKDKNGAAATKKYTVKVTQTTVTGDIPTTTTRRAAFTGTPKVSGGAASYTWSISEGKLPDGLKINASTGKITGTATKAGNFTFTVKAKDKNGAAATKKYTVNVTQTTVSGTLANATKGSSYTGSPKASGGASPYIWSVSAGSLPKGLKLNTSTGKITGTPTAIGTFKFTLKAKDKNGAAGTKAYTVKVTAPTKKSATPESKPDTKNDGQISTQEHNTVSALPATPPTISKSAGNTAINLAPSLRVISDDILESHEDRDNDIFTVKAGKPLTFILDGEISGAIICIDDEPIENITISDDGTFMLPAEFVSGDFKVQVKSSDGNNESQEAFIISE